MEKFLVTGAAGFIGFHTSQRLIKDGHQVVGIDNLNDYYDVNLKKARLERLVSQKQFKFFETDIAHKEQIFSLFKEEKFDKVINLAAQAGVRYSLINPYAYINSNILGFTNILEACRHNETKHLVYASSSSIYGANKTMPFSIHHNVDHPLSLYAATKKANELMAHTYSALYQLPTTGLRFFTVYGPWGRPDMALFLFTKNILEGRPIDIYNNGHHRRDFTYVDDIVEGVVRVAYKTATPNPKWDAKAPDPGTSFCPWRVYNIGSNRPVDLMRYIEIIENTLGIEAKKNFLPMQKGDVEETYADVDALIEDIDYAPRTDIETGIQSFLKWYRDFYKI